MQTDRRSFLLAATATALSAQTPPKIRIANVRTGHRAWAHSPVL